MTYVDFYSAIKVWLVNRFIIASDIFAISWHVYTYCEIHNTKNINKIFHLLKALHIVS